MSKSITFVGAPSTPVVRTAIADLLHLWLLRHRYRQQLRTFLAMGSPLIADMGMTMEEARREAELSFWQGSIAIPLKPLGL